MMNSVDVVNKLKERINKSDEQVTRKKNESDETIALDKEAINMITNLKSEVASLRALDLARAKTLSTTQFFNPSLAKNMYNMDGNSLQTNSYLAVRQMLGIVNNNTPGVKQPLDGVDVDNGGASLSNGTGVGLTENGVTAKGWWLWIMVLRRITYFSQLVKWNCEDRSLRKALNDYMFDVVLSGYAGIEKIGDKYRSWAITDVKIGEDGELKKFSYYNSGFVMGQGVNLGENEGLKTKENDDSWVVGKWRTNGYNIWFYVMAYLMHATDLWYIFWSRALLQKPILLQLKGNQSSASEEVMQILDPNNIVVPVNSAGLLIGNASTGEGESSALNEFENRYDVKTLVTPEEVASTFTSLNNWIDRWDAEVGVRTTPANSGDGTRKVTDEIEPFNLSIDKMQQDITFQLDLLVDEIKEKFGVEVSYEYEDEQVADEEAEADPAVKDEGGNESEEKENDGK